MKSLYRVWVLLLLSQSVFAAPLSPADHNSIEQHQQQLLFQNQQQRESLELAVPRTRSSQPEQTISTSGPCFTINRITLNDTTLIDARRQQKLLAPWLNQCLNMTRINQLTNTVSDWYISRGYITSRAFLTEQDLRSGELHLSILEGRLEKIRMDGAPERELKMTFPGLEGNICQRRVKKVGLPQLGWNLSGQRTHHSSP